MINRNYLHMHKSDKIKQFILENLTRHQKDIIKASIRKFGLSRQGILKHMNSLIKEDRVVAHGKTRDRYYELKPLFNISKSINITEKFNPQEILRNLVFPNFSMFTQNIREICEFSLGALFYNILYHAHATRLYYKLYGSYYDIHLIVSDNGIGLFHGIADAFDLDNIL